jgi:hypothetical protein
MSENVSRTFLFLFLSSAVSTENELVEGYRLHGVPVKFIQFLCSEAL